jgi:hypothetical protein
MNAIANLIQDANLIVDCDEILVNVSPLWVKKIIENKELFEEHLDLSKVIEVMEDEAKFNELVLRRDKYYLTDWLKREDIEKVPAEIIAKFMDLYNDDEMYYSALPITRMAAGLQKLSYHPSVKKVYVITKCTDGKNYDKKEALIRSLFPDRKLEIRKVPIHEKKSAYVKDIDIKNGFIFEDELSNIKDYLENSTISECNIYVPMLGYNKPNAELMLLVEEKKICLSYY